MDSRREQILFLLSVFMVMKYVIVDILALQKLAIFEQNVQMMMMAVFIIGGGQRRVISQRSCWQFERHGGFMEHTLFGSFSEVQFQRRMRVRISTFKYLCALLGPVLRKKDTRIRDSISVETRVAVTISRLGTGNTLVMIADLFKIGVSTASEIVRECCEAIRIHLRPLVFKNRLWQESKQLLQNLKQCMAFRLYLEQLMVVISLS